MIIAEFFDNSPWTWENYPTVSKKYMNEENIAPVVEKKFVISPRTYTLFFWILFLIFFFIPGYYFFTVNGNILLEQKSFSVLTISLFPLVGLYAYFFFWMQIILGANMRIFIRKMPWVYQFHKREGIFAFLLALLHPALLVSSIGLEKYFSYAFVSSDRKIFVVIGQIQIFFLLITSLTAIFMKVSFLQKRWRTIHYLNYIVFYGIWIHSWFLGSTVRFTSLKYLWIFFIISATISIMGKIIFVRRRR